MTEDVSDDVIIRRYRDRQYREAAERIRILEIALDKINYIRDNIIGTQSLNWSEHVYPLVAALDEAGFTGMEYPESRKFFGTLVSRAVAAEDRVKELENQLVQKSPETRCPTCWGTGKKNGKSIGKREECKECNGTGDRDGGKFFAPDNDSCTHCTHCNKALDEHHGKYHRCEKPESCELCMDSGYVNEASGGGTKPRMPGTPQVYGTKITRVPCPECKWREILGGIAGM